MSWRPSSTLRVLVVLVGLSIASALALGRPEPVVLAAPFALTMLALLAAARSPALRISAVLDDDHVVEGDTTSVRVRIVSETHLSSLELALVLPDGLSAPATERGVAMTLAAGETRTWSAPIECDRWGNHRVGPIALRARSPLGLLVAEGQVESNLELQVYPSAHTLRGLVRPREPHTSAGNRVTRMNGTGIEFADIRPFVPGDRARDVNWRVTARRGDMYVNQQHPDRSSDVVVLLDAFSEVTLAAAVSAASALANAYLQHRDRVGVVSIGGYMQWLHAGAGLRQEYMLVKTLLDTQAFAIFADKGLDQIPPHVLPSKALVLALSPLHDERFRRLVVDLRARGVDVVVIEVSLEPFVPPAPGTQGNLAYRLWRLHRGVGRDQLREQGIPVVVWDETEPLAVAIEEVAAWPRVARASR